MSIKYLALLMLTHVLSDFLLQDRETAKKKSSSWRYLIGHLYIIHMCLSVFGLLVDEYTTGQAFAFAFFNTVLHGLIDWNLWSLYKYSVLKRFPDVDLSFQYWEDKWFYNFIAFDQLLHGLSYLGVHILIKEFLS